MKNNQIKIELSKNLKDETKSGELTFKIIKLLDGYSPDDVSKAFLKVNAIIMECSFISYQD
jgi:hypothetical protein